MISFSEVRMKNQAIALLRLAKHSNAELRTILHFCILNSFVLLFFLQICHTPI